MDSPYYDALLARYPTPFESCFVPTRAGSTHVLISGPVDAPPLFLIHGSGTNALSWGLQVEAFSQHYRVFAVEIPGQPGKSERVRPSIRKGAIGDWLCDVVHALSAQPIHLIGLSLGGWVALKFASYHPERVKKLVLLAPAGVVRVQKRNFVRYMLPVLWRGEPGYLHMIRKMAHRDLDQEVIGLMLDCYRQRTLMTSIIPTVLPASEMRRVSAPTLALIGTTDFFFHPGATRRRLNRLIPHALVKQFPACDHYIPYDQSERMMAEIMPFLASGK